jgi:hypothetical protein
MAFKSFKAEVFDPSLKTVAGTGLVQQRLNLLLFHIQNVLRPLLLELTMRSG